MSLTETFSVGFTSSKSLTVKSLAGISAESPVVLSVTVTLPLSSAVTIVFGLDSLTLSTNFSISLGVKCSGSGTTIGSGIVTSNSFAGSPLKLINFASYGTVGTSPPTGMSIAAGFTGCHTLPVLSVISFGV